jgi:small subunit ribosomal protein S17
VRTEKEEKPEKTVKPKAEKAPKAEKPAAKAAAPRKKPAAKAPEEAGARESARTSTRKLRQGIVVSNKMAKTVTVKIERRVQHPLYGKIVLRTEKFKAHDETNQCDIGDVVELMETRPISREKRFRVTRIVEKVK